MKHKLSTRLLSLLLVIATLAGLLIPASAASLGGSRTVKITQWDPDRVIALVDAGRSDTICLEAWDMFKNGVYYKTLYEIGIDQKEAGPA